MSEVLFITPAEVTATTIMGGNVDPERYLMNIAFVQVSVIEPLLGTELYNKISSDFENGILIDKYEELFNNYVKPITKYQAIAEYIEVSQYMIENGGAFKLVAEGRESLTKDEISALSGKYRTMAQMYVERFKKWICHNNIPEYKRYQDEVNAQSVELKSGWYFGSVGGFSSGQIDKVVPDYPNVLNCDLDTDI